MRRGSGVGGGRMEGVACSMGFGCGLFRSLWCWRGPLTNPHPSLLPPPLRSWLCWMGALAPLRGLAPSEGAAGSETARPTARGAGKAWEEMLNPIRLGPGKGRGPGNDTRPPVPALPVGAGGDLVEVRRQGPAQQQAGPVEPALDGRHAQPQRFGDRRVGQALD